MPAGGDLGDDREKLAWRWLAVPDAELSIEGRADSLAAQLPAD